MSEGFTCAICQRQIRPMLWTTRGERDTPPICYTCENVGGYDWTGRARNRTKPTGGAFMDRRYATRVLALADELASVAKQQEWSKKYGY